MTTRRPWFWALGSLLALGLLAYVLRADIALAVAQRVAAQRLAADALERLPDGLHVGLCGAGSPFPDERRSGPCTLVIAGRQQLVFDTGAGASRQIGKMGFNAGRIDAVFLSHFHSDHIDGLGELLLQRWVSSSHRLPVPVHGPAGVEQVLGGFMQAYAQDQRYRVAHHGDATVPASGFGGVARPFELQPGSATVVFQRDGVEVAAFLVDHAPVHPSVGYRIRYKNRSIVLSGDTRRSSAVEREARDADVLVHEALSPSLVALLQDAAAQAGRPNLKKVFGDILDYHATPTEAADSARAAGVAYLLLNHIVPTLPPLPGMEKLFLGDAPRHFDGPIRVGTDGDFVSLPAGTREVQAGHRP